MFSADEAQKRTLCIRKLIDSKNFIIKSLEREIKDACELGLSDIIYNSPIWKGRHDSDSEISRLNAELCDMIVKDLNDAGYEVAKDRTNPDNPPEDIRIITWSHVTID